MIEREFFITIKNDVTLRVRYSKDRGRILRFVVQLEAYFEQTWVPITRYDNAHNFIHRDDLKPDGSQIKSPPMLFENNEEAINYAINDLRLNSEFYVERYFKWQN